MFSHHAILLLGGFAQPAAPVSRAYLRSQADPEDLSDSETEG